MSEMGKAVYDSKQALPNKLLKEDGTITDLAGNPAIGSVDAYENKPALPNKWMNPDGSYSTLNEIVAGMIDNDIFVIVDELPTTGETDKIYLLAKDSKFIEYLWVNNKWDPIGMVEFNIEDYYNKEETTQLISAALQAAKDYAKQYTDNAVVELKTITHIFIWSTRGDTSQESLDMWTNLYVTNKTAPVLLCYVYSEWGLNVVVPIPTNYFDTHVLTTPGAFYKGVNTNNTSLQITIGTEQWHITVENDKVVDVVRTTNSWTNFNVLEIDKNYSNPYTPLYDGSPATKKYVDDAITNNITAVLEESY